MEKTYSLSRVHITNNYELSISLITQNEHINLGWQLEMPNRSIVNIKKNIKVLPKPCPFYMQSFTPKDFLFDFISEYHGRECPSSALNVLHPYPTPGLDCPNPFPRYSFLYGLN